MKLTDHFTLAEMTVSQEAARSGLKNVPSAAQVESLRLLCENVLEPLRVRLKRPVVVNSGFRSSTVNRRIGGAANSQHCKGQAADIIVPGMSVAEVVARIRKMALPFDQLLDEYGQWVHVSYGPRHRRQTLIARHEGGKTVWRQA